MQTPTVSLGIDIRKATFHAAVLKADNRAQVREFANTDTGFEALSQWLNQPGVEQVHEWMEATRIDVVGADRHQSIGSSTVFCT